MRACRRPIPLAARVARLDHLGLRPVADPLIDAAHAECPRCRAGEADPLGLYRPLTWGATGAACCSACGREGHV